VERLLNVASYLRVRNAATDEEREALEAALTEKPLPPSQVREPGAPSWWHGEEAAAAEAMQVMARLRRVT
jgi:hypothetical protein